MSDDDASMCYSQSEEESGVKPGLDVMIVDRYVMYHGNGVGALSKEEWTAVARSMLLHLRRPSDSVLETAGAELEHMAAAMRKPPNPAELLVAATAVAGYEMTAKDAWTPGATSASELHAALAASHTDREVRLNVLRGVLYLAMAGACGADTDRM